MKAIISNNGTYEVIKEHGDFYIARDNRGKEKMFAKHLVEVIEIDALPKAKNYGKPSGLTKAQKNARDMAAYNALSPMEKATRELLSVNGLCAGDRNSTGYNLWANKIAEIELSAKDSGNSFVEDVAKSVYNYMKVSDKQAYVLAKFATENNINF